MSKKTALHSLNRAIDLVFELERNQAFARAVEDAFDNQRPEDAQEQIEAYNDSVGTLFKRINENLNECREGMAELIHQNLVARANRHKALLKAITNSGAVVVTLHDTNEAGGFCYLDQIAPLPERLNMPTGALIGKPVTFLPPAISKPRFHHIKKAIANGQCETYSYTYEDEHLWRFDVAVAPLYGSEEVITIVTDAEAWQTGFWERGKQSKI